MKIPNRTLYGLKLMLHLAINFEGNFIALNEIAKSENISEKFLENIVAAIKAKGLVKVKRGAKGGYYLAKPPAHISLKEILEALESDIFNKDWQKHEDITIADTIIKKNLLELDNLIAGFLKAKTLEELLKLYESMKPSRMFYI